MTEYEYEYYSAFQKWPNTNTNNIRLSKNERIRIRILFGLKKHPNTNTNIIRHGNFYRIRIRIRIVPTPYTSESIIQFLEVDLFLIVLNFNTHTQRKVRDHSRHQQSTQLCHRGPGTPGAVWGGRARGRRQRCRKWRLRGRWKRKWLWWGLDWFGFVWPEYE